MLNILAVTVETTIKIVMKGVSKALIKTMKTMQENLKIEENSLQLFRKQCCKQLQFQVQEYMPSAK